MTEDPSKTPDSLWKWAGRLPHSHTFCGKSIEILSFVSGLLKPREDKGLHCHDGTGGVNPLWGGVEERKRGSLYCWGDHPLLGVDSNKTLLIGAEKKLLLKGHGGWGIIYPLGLFFVRAGAAPPSPMG